MMILMAIISNVVFSFVSSCGWICFPTPLASCKVSYLATASCKEKWDARSLQSMSSYCPYATCNPQKNTSRRLQDPPQKTLATAPKYCFALKRHAPQLSFFCNFSISPFLSCTKVTSKGPKAKRLLGECGGTMPSITPRSEVPRTRFSHFSFVVLPCPMEQMVQTLDGRSLVLTSIIAGSRAAFRVHGIPPLSARTHLRHVL